MITTPLPLRLGRLPARNDPRTLKLRTYLPPGLAPPPQQVDWLSIVEDWPMYANDEIGDCTVASAGHMIHTWTKNADLLDIPTEPEIVHDYSAITGYDPSTGENDNGAYMLDVLNFWRRRGIAEHKIIAYAAVDPTDEDEVCQAVNLFGGIYVGAAMPLSAQYQTHNRRKWTVAYGPNGEPYSWGGHAFHIGQYDKSGLTCITWGDTQQMTWPWWTRYVDEAYAIVTVDLLDAAGVSPLGFNLQVLLQDLAQINRDNTNTNPRLSDRIAGLLNRLRTRGQ